MTGIAGGSGLRGHSAIPTACGFASVGLVRIASLVAIAVVVWSVAAPVQAAPRRDRARAQRPGSADAPAPAKKPALAPVARDPSQVRIAELEREVRGHQLARRSYQTVSPLRKLYALQRQHLGVTDARTEGTRQQLGAALLATGRYREAVAMYRDGVVIAEQTAGKDSKEAAQAMSALISVYWLQGRYPDAEALYQRALPIWKKQYGEVSSVYAGVLSGYAGFLSSWSSFGAAQRSYEEALRIYESLAPSADDVSLLAPLQALASLYWNTGSQPRAMPLFNRVLAINDHRPNGEAQARASMVFSIASVYHHGGRPDLAKPLFERARAIYRDEIVAKEQAGAKGYDDGEEPGRAGSGPHGDDPRDCDRRNRCRRIELVRDAGGH
jgi:tetratricopeptide (TPR) repeat protein